ncbi:MAG: hypothetical protein R2850_12205 [Bacteroidia bacterium]
MRLIITLAAGIASFSMMAQSPAALLDSTKIWSCYGDFFYLNVKYKLGGDTLIQGRIYKR